jgi:hypothetical protein
LKNAVLFYNAGVVIANSKVAGLAPGKWMELHTRIQTKRVSDKETAATGF